MKHLKFMLCALGVLALAMGVAACGDDDDDGDDSAATTTETASAETVDVTGTEYSFDLSATPTTDTKEITFTNDGAEDHDLIFAKINEGYTLDEAFEAQGRKGTAEDLGATFAKPARRPSRSSSSNRSSRATTPWSARFRPRTASCTTTSA